jgi:hypothetical protein
MMSTQIQERKREKQPSARRRHWDAEKNMLHYRITFCCTALGYQQIFARDYAPPFWPPTNAGASCNLVLLYIVLVYPGAGDQQRNPRQIGWTRVVLVTIPRGNIQISGFTAMAIEIPRNRRKKREETDAGS